MEGFSRLEPPFRGTPRHTPRGDGSEFLGAGCALSRCLPAFALAYARCATSPVAGFSVTRKSGNMPLPVPLVVYPSGLTPATENVRQSARLGGPFFAVWTLYTPPAVDVGASIVGTSRAGGSPRTFSRYSEIE